MTPSGHSQRTKLWSSLSFIVCFPSMAAYMPNPWHITLPISDDLDELKKIAAPRHFLSYTCSVLFFQHCFRTRYSRKDRVCHPRGRAYSFVLMHNMPSCRRTRTYIRGRRITCAYASLFIFIFRYFFFSLCFPFPRFFSASVSRRLTSSVWTTQQAVVTQPAVFEFSPWSFFLTLRQKERDREKQRKRALEKNDEEYRTILIVTINGATIALRFETASPGAVVIPRPLTRVERKDRIGEELTGDLSRCQTVYKR